MIELIKEIDASIVLFINDLCFDFFSDFMWFISAKSTWIPLYLMMLFYLYKKMDNSNILIGENTHWRTVKESLLTFMTSKKMIEKYFEKLIDMATKESNPFEKNLHEIYEKEYCFSPIPSLAMHATNINTIYGLPPNFDWKKIWEENTP